MTHGLDTCDGCMNLTYSGIIKWVVIETTGVCEVTTFAIHTDQFAIHRSISPKRSGISHWCLYRHQ